MEGNIYAHAHAEYIDTSPTRTSRRSRRFSSKTFGIPQRARSLPAGYNKNDEANISVPPLTREQVKKLAFGNQIQKLEAKAILLTCMDFRFLENIVTVMGKKGYKLDYDHFILAGASLACTQKEFEDWADLFKKHVTLAEKLHNVKEIVCIDHENCGAYNLFYRGIKKEDEIAKHAENMIIFKEKMYEAFPGLEVRGLYLKLSGKVIEL